MIGYSNALCAVTPFPGDPSTHVHRLKKVNDYLLCAKIGTGSSSSVYLAIDEITQRRYAVKRFKLCDLMESSNGLAQLEHEIRLMRIVKHANIVRFIGILYASSSDEAFLVLDYVDRGTLAAVIEKCLPLSVSDTFSILKQISNAVKYLHDTGLIHQDVKPATILLDSQGRALLADFGIGHSFHSVGMVAGSPAYQAPEALEDSSGSDNEEDINDEPQKEDVWALGVTLYQMLFRRLPFQGSTLFEIVNDIKARGLEIPEGTNPAVARLLRGMLTIDPVARWSIEAVLADPLVQGASDYAAAIPDHGTVQVREGTVVEVCAKVCPVGWSFAGCGKRVAKPFSWENAPGDQCAPLRTSSPPMLSGFL
jgi:serine/threonine-protein kinase 11